MRAAGVFLVIALLATACTDTVSDEAIEDVSELGEDDDDVAEVVTKGDEKEDT